jgi:hypothetical protein
MWIHVDDVAAQRTQAAQTQARVGWADLISRDARPNRLPALPEERLCSR